jgi:hypothetical protein
MLPQTCRELAGYVGWGRCFPGGIDPKPQLPVARYQIENVYVQAFIRHSVRWNVAFSRAPHHLVENLLSLGLNTEGSCCRTVELRPPKHSML